MCAEVIAAAPAGQNAVAVAGVSKYFEIYKKPTHRLYQMICRGRRQFYEPFWALRDISFNVGKGECLGIIGRNGAGKSTLLQIISRTLAPSSGQIEINGRVAALLELGSGFNPEFTGRENVRLNAAILGLSRKEIDERFDSIAAFAEIGDFMDQPVKNYSSGMALRLAFAVIAHVDAEIMIIDEALSVGDAFFTQKCMRFMRKFIDEHTVIFVSHDIAAVNSLCNRVILLENGRIKQDGSPKDVTETYLKDMYEERQGSEVLSELEPEAQEEPAENAKTCSPVEYRDMRADMINASKYRNDIQVFAFNEESAAFGKKGITITNAMLLDKDGHPLSWIVGGEPVELRVSLESHADICGPIVGFLVRNRYGQHLFGDNTFITYQKSPLIVRKGQNLEASFWFTMPILEPGDYSISIAVAEGTQQDHVQHDWKHDAIMLQSVSSSCQTGIMGIPMKNIKLSLLKKRDN